MGYKLTSSKRQRADVLTLGWSCCTASTAKQTLIPDFVTAEVTLFRRVLATVLPCSAVLAPALQFLLESSLLGPDITTAPGAVAFRHKTPFAAKNKETPLNLLSEYAAPE